MDWDYVAHIIRDVFPQTTFTTLYGRSKELLDVLHTPKHGIGAFMMHTERGKYLSNDECKYWEAGINGIYFGQSICDLFISFNYDPELLNDDTDMVARQIKSFLKPGGFAMVVNPGVWANDLGKYLTINAQVETEIKRYSMFKNENVLVYENI
jgi:hypothetical protein